VLQLAEEKERRSEAKAKQQASRTRYWIDNYSQLMIPGF